jgi:hypothetical protein
MECHWRTRSSMYFADTPRSIHRQAAASAGRKHRWPMLNTAWTLRNGGRGDTGISSFGGPPGVGFAPCGGSRPIHLSGPRQRCRPRRSTAPRALLSYPADDFSCVRINDSVSPDAAGDLAAVWVDDACVSDAAGDLAAVWVDDACVADAASHPARVRINDARHNGDSVRGVRQLSLADGPLSERQCCMAELSPRCHGPTTTYESI